MNTKVKNYLSNYPVIYSILSGLLLSFGWPPSPFAWLLLVAYIPMIHVILNAHALKKAFYYSFITFFVYGMTTMFWVIKVDMGFLGQLVTFLFGFGFMSFLRTIPFLLFVWVYKKVKHPFIWVSLPVFYVTYEFLQSKWELSLNWLDLGLGLSQYPAWIQFYELTGISGGTFLILLVNILLYNIAIQWKVREVKRKLLIATSLLLFSVAVVNFSLYRSENQSQDITKRVNVAIVQPNINPYTEVNDTILKSRLVVFDQLYEQYMNNRKIDLIVCPEGFLRGSEKSPIVINTLDSNWAIKAFKQIARRHHAAILTGFIGYELYTNRPASSSAKPTGDGRYYDVFNAAAFITPNLPTDVYTKNKLVAFMERVPFLDQFSFLENLHLDLNQARQSYARKNEVRIFSYRNLKVAPVICLESTYPDYVRQFILKGVNLIAVMTNDGWGGHTNGPYQNLSYCSPLGITFRKNIVRSANTGISASVDNYGSQTENSSYGIPAVIVKEVALTDQNTFFCNNGNLTGWLSVTASSILLISLLALKIKNSYKRE